MSIQSFSFANMKSPLMNSFVSFTIRAALQLQPVEKAFFPVFARSVATKQSHFSSKK